VRTAREYLADQRLDRLCDTCLHRHQRLTACCPCAGDRVWFG
jgi:hypothetical protein